MIATAALALLAGIFSTLSPCVLPLLPVVLGAAVSHHKLGPVALSLGLGIAFVTIGLFVAVIGFSIGLDLTVFRMIGGVIMIGIGTVLMAPMLQLHLASAASPFGNWTEQRYGNFDAGGLKGQFLVGLLLGAVWSPCVGPTLGAASLLAASGKNLGQVAATMLIFGLGATLPLLLLGFLSRDMLLRSRSWLLGAGQGGKFLLGSLLIVVGLLIVTGLDKKAEAVIVSHSPAWLTALTTRF
ncbi:cytochrome c biogenesis protein transmembrane region (plasmid) [Rhizobium leguminosarum bv. trifolii WSM1325]|uniref:Cytochrome c biogenesis protein transmembrane region n=1 Tax=Rhizobium leguminosarum bv. trifolii (strain WSM1325) TaxID=395491 RepID=C6B8M3_RHILS|nr:cytochrome c biogenesis protein CcdA [Rhizobium leguminosarum]ACS60261.1 cytochrome c biogenesis protein transmembrane region [Rhizobium leguminosarum bv. trifolii WSM1325]